MEKLTDITQEGLVDLLAELTTKYLKMMSEGSSIDEINTSKEKIDRIVEEIKKRHDKKNVVAKSE